MITWSGSNTENSSSRERLSRSRVADSEFQFYAVQLGGAARECFLDEKRRGEGRMKYCAVINHCLQNSFSLGFLFMFSLFAVRFASLSAVTLNIGVGSGTSSLLRYHILGVVDACNDRRESRLPAKRGKKEKETLTKWLWAEENISQLISSRSD